MFHNLKEKSKKLKCEVTALHLASKRNDVPILPKIIAVIVTAYAFSPIDLIPDFIPILGYLDDVILLPLGIMLVIKLIPTDIMNECRMEAENLSKENKPKRWLAGIIIILIWLILIVWIIFKFH